MNTDQPKPTGEWTVQSEGETCGIYPRFGTRIVGGLNRKQADYIVATHNAELAAERDRYDDLQRSVMDLSHPNCQGLLNERNEARQQLASERELADKGAVRAELAQIELAKLQDTYSLLLNERDQLQDQLAAERSRNKAYEGASGG